MTRTALLGLLPAVLCALLPHGRAEACVNEVERTLRRETRAVVEAEEALDAGHPDRAFVAAMRPMARLDTFAETFGNTGSRARELRTRALRVAAIAVVRLDGAVDREHRRAVRQIEAEAQAENMRWALDILHEQQRTTDDPLLQARYAEALARFPARREDARRILARLHTDDLMPDAWAYRILSELERTAGDAEAAAAALDRCNQRAGVERARICPTPSAS